MPRPSIFHIEVWILLVLPLLQSAVCEDILKQIIVVTRHGSRYPLIKDGSTLVESSTGMLTAIGQKQLYDLGKDLQTTYNKPGLLDTYHPNDVRLESSAYERTITSANSLALGLFTSEARDPDNENLMPVEPANVPVYTYDQENDILIRAYDKCPVLQNRLEVMFNSAEWKQIETDNKALLAGLAQETAFAPFSNPDGIIPLKELWNVFDLVFVAKTECGGTGQKETAICKTLPNPELATILSDEDWAQLQKLSHQAELMKYGQETAGKIGGANLLVEISKRMRNEDYTFSLFSAHYPTILSVFAALEEPFFEEDVIPHYASALIFEVTEPSDGEDKGKLFFKLIYRGNDNNRVVQLDHICGNSLVCPVSSLVEFLGVWDDAKWCRDCNNESANVCLKLKIQEMENGDEDGLEYPLEAGLFIGLSVGIFGICVTACIMLRRREKKEVVSTQDNYATDPTDVTSAPAPLSTGGVSELPWRSVPQNVVTGPLQYGIQSDGRSTRSVVSSSPQYGMQGDDRSVRSSAAGLPRNGMQSDDRSVRSSATGPPRNIMQSDDRSVRSSATGLPRKIIQSDDRSVRSSATGPPRNNMQSDDRSVSTDASTSLRAVI